MSEIYAAGDHQYSNVLGLGLWGTDEVTTDNFLILDAAFGALTTNIDINGIAVPNPNFVDSASVTFSVVGSNVHATAVGGGSGAWATLTGDLTETQVIPWDGATPGTHTTGISRTADGTLAIGNGTQGNASGTLELTHLTLVGTKNTTINSGATGADWTLTLPVDAGTGHPGYVLSTDGSGTTSWVAQSGSSGVPANTTLWTAPASLANSATNWSDCTIIVRMPGTHLLAPATSWKIRLTASAGTGIHIQAFKIFKVLSNQNSPSTAGSSVVSSTSVTVGGNMPATVISAAPFDIVTDAISLTLDPLYDYYMVLYLDTDGTYNGTLGFYRNNNTSDLLFGALGTPFSGGYVVGDHSADATLPALTSGNYAFNSGSVYAIKRVLSA